MAENWSCLFCILWSDSMSSSSCFCGIFL